MLFNSLEFLYGFLPVVYLTFWQLKTNKQRYVWLTAASYFFYGWWNWKFCFWMAFSTAVSYFAGLGLLRYSEGRKRRLCLILPIVADLSILGFFKYTNFFRHSLQALLSQWGPKPAWPDLHILLPVGISFYTFHTISYIVDSYRGTVRPTRNFWEFACYVSLFSQLVAGPIVRFRQIEADLEHIDRNAGRENLDTGWSFFAIGMCKKLLLADTIAMIIDPALSQWRTLSGLGLWLCVLGYTYQLYFDFSGYSDMAIGLGRLFGLRLPQNFNSPYKADSPGDFWRRWHMSLSTCLRDYLYIPLGGNRGPGWFVARNLMITMLLGGLWHGANWTFVIWGSYHGFLLVAQRVSSAKEGPEHDRNLGFFNRAGPTGIRPVYRRMVTFLLVVIGWVFFRAPDLPAAAAWLQGMFGGRSGHLPTGIPILVPALILGALFAHFGPNSFELRHRWSPRTSMAFGAAFALCLLVMYGAHPAPFLYFQF